MFRVGILKSWRSVLNLAGIVEPWNIGIFLIVLCRIPLLCELHFEVNRRAVHPAKQRRDTKNVLFTFHPAKQQRDIENVLLTFSIFPPFPPPTLRFGG